MEYLFIAITRISTLIQKRSSSEVLSMGQMELFNHLTVCIQMTDIKMNY